MNDLTRRGDRLFLYWIAALAVCTSIAAFIWFFSHGETLLYGDAVAHINIARRVFDSREPGPLQLGTVWLPFPHLVQIPFVINNWMWRTGAGPAVPSMIAYVLGVIGIFRLVRTRTNAWTGVVAAAIYGLNPSLLYMQSTGMTESIFLAAMIWSVVYFDEYVRGLFPPDPGDGVEAVLPPWKALERSGLALGVAIFTRYDGWVLAFVAGILAFVLLWRSRKDIPAGLNFRRLLRSFVAFALFLALCPTLWLAHNYAISRKPLDWLNGPYSAKAIEKRTSLPGEPPYPGKNSMKVAAQYFFKSARMNMSEGDADKFLVSLALLGTLVAAFYCRQFGSLFLLWFPLPFYAYSVAYGSVPIFLPVWWPFSYYNVRYGLELLPMFAVFIAVSVWALSGIRVKGMGPIVSAAVVLIVAAGYISSAHGHSAYKYGVQCAKSGPICIREARVNSAARLIMEHWIGDQLKKLPDNTSILIEASSHVGAVQYAGIPLKRTINESDDLVWVAALSAPGATADYVVSVGNSTVAQAVKTNPRGLVKVAEFDAPENSPVILYRSTLRGK